MPITEEKAITILEELIRKPETKAEDIPRIWSELINIYNTQFAPPEAPKKKRRRAAGSPNIGWPAGVSRAEFKDWKEAQQANGVTEGLNPQEYKRQVEAGQIDRAKYGSGFFAKQPKPAPKTEAKKAPAKKKSAK